MRQVRFGAATANADSMAATDFDWLKPITTVVEKEAEKLILVWVEWVVAAFPPLSSDARLYDWQIDRRSDGGTLEVD